MSTEYRSAPESITTAPRGIPYIVTNEAAERFSFYGMKGILVVFMTQYLLSSDGSADFLDQETAMVWYHNFTSAVYFFPLIGALIADWFFGKYRTILWLSIIYCLGHLSLAFMDMHMPFLEPRNYLMIGLMLIAVGSGGIKPCVSAHVGDQFGKTNAHLMERIFGWFYLSINLGAFVSTLLTPWLLSNPNFGPAWAFGIPGVLMAAATVFFWMGRKVFIHIPAGGSEFIKETFSAKGLGSMGKLFGIYLFVAMFWALFDQTGSAWVLQAEKMNRNFMGFEWLSSQIQAINPIMIILLVPLFNSFVYPAINKVFPLTPLRKIGIGFFLTVPAFLLPAWIESQIAAGEAVNIGWQLFAYALITAAEIFVSITCLEFSYTQSPKRMKSFIMAIYLFSVSLGNQFVSFFNLFIQNPKPEIELMVPGEYVFSLSATDGSETVVKEMRVNVMETKPKTERLTEKIEKDDEIEPPSVSFTETLLVIAPNEPLNIFASTDFGTGEGDAAYTWTVEGPSPANIKDSNKRFSTFTSTEQGEYTVSLELGVGALSGQESLTVLVTNENVAPVVNLPENKDFVLYVRCQGIGGIFDSECTEKQSLSLNAAGTYDPNGDELTYEWNLLSQPEQSVLSNDNIQGRQFAFPTSKVTGSNYYMFFAGCMFLTALGFIPYATRYKEETYIQDESDTE